MKSVSKSTILRVFALMKDQKPHTCPDLSRDHEMAPTCVAHAMKTLNAMGEVHIKRWRTNPVGTLVAEWVYGAGENAPKPPPRPRSVRIMERKKKRQAEAKRLKVVEPEPQPVKVERHWMDAALFGEHTA